MNVALLTPPDLSNVLVFFRLFPTLAPPDSSLARGRVRSLLIKEASIIQFGIGGEGASQFAHRGWFDSLHSSWSARHGVKDIHG